MSSNNKPEREVTENQENETDEIEEEEEEIEEESSKSNDRRELIFPIIKRTKIFAFTFTLLIFGFLYLIHEDYDHWLY